MPNLRFGTDGVRGVANVEVTPELALALGRAAARVLGPAPAFVVGADPRRSSPLLLAALAAGITSEGIDVVDLGVVPTPTVAWESARRGVPGAMVSASHNPFSDNGIKLFAAGGRKLGDDTEAAIEAALAAPGGPAPAGADVGTLAGDQRAAAQAWAQSVVGTLEGRVLEGLTVVLDCANGAASSVAPGVLGALGATVDVINAEPDGMNINDGCGATYPEAAAAVVVERGADLGIALDGDADRCIAVDHEGRVVDGDQILAVLALDRQARGTLPGGAVVVTVMSNLGFRLAMAERGIEVVETAVGDRYVLDALDAEGLVLGGEQSGHVIQRDLATTGDGVLTAAHLCDVVARSGRPLADLASVVERLPQVLRNVRLAQRDEGLLAAVAGDVAAAEAELGERGRVLLRPSGTEPVVRVMVEAPTEEQAGAVADRLVAALERAATGPSTGQR
jgi:phosphoglucosamine mutase